MSESKVSTYLHALEKACIEGAREPRVRALLFMLLLRAPRTLLQIAADEQRARLAA
jgi:hypothetical protein